MTGMSDNGADGARPEAVVVPAVDTGSAAVEAAAESLKRYWRTGEGAAKIRWGTKGDLTRCISLVRRAAGVSSQTFDVAGFCNNLHKDIFGVPNPRD